MLSSDYKLAFVVVLKKGADALTQSFWDALVSLTTARIESTRTGRALISTSSNGKVVAYAMPATASNLTEVAIAELCGELMRYYRQAKADLILAGTAAVPATPTDGEIYEELLGYLEPVYEVGNDYTGLRE